MWEISQIPLYLPGGAYAIYKNLYSFLANMFDDILSGRKRRDRSISFFLPHLKSTVIPGVFHATIDLCFAERDLLNIT